MKTPREVLLKRHETAQAKLDLVRAQALAEIVPTRKVQNASRQIRASYWLQELIRSFRPQLTALAAVWLVIFGLHLASSETSESTMVATTTPSPEVMATLREQKRLYTQLIGPSEITKPVEPALPDRRPRSEERQLIRIV
jgi:hypothetical protein